MKDDDKLPPMIRGLMPTFQLLIRKGDGYSLPPEAAATLCLAQAIDWLSQDEDGNPPTVWVERCIRDGVASAIHDAVADGDLPEPGGQS